MTEPTLKAYDVARAYNIYSQFILENEMPDDLGDITAIDAIDFVNENITPEQQDELYWRSNTIP